jgi:hypothetical protein
MGVCQATWAGGIVLGPLLAGWVADAYGLPAAFVTAAAAAASGLGFQLRKGVEGESLRRAD